MTQEPVGSVAAAAAATQALTESEEWPEGWAQYCTMLVALGVKRVRAERKMSAQQLSDRCAELGMPIARSVLANLESGRRSSISLPEVLILARALRVSPIALCFPVGYVATYVATPFETVDTWAAVKWFTGEAPFPGERAQATENIDAAGDPDKLRVLDGMSDMAGIYRHHDSYANYVRKQREGLESDRRQVAAQMEKGITDELHGRLLSVSEQNVQIAEGNLIKLRRTLRDAGLLVLPPLGDDLRDLDELGQEL
ncbi:helix-turn-helix domain-containing protein [Streptomyces virginiae]|uniref:helix-turn-helix domain-containing protein n=1 Tax=Streptomyces virginiae TaxID=1961 RepID=UPI0034132388